MIYELELNNFTVFKKANLQFGRKINVLIGENGSGKTLLLKFLYAAIRLLPLHQKERKSFLQSKELENFLAVFKVDMVADLVNMEYKNKMAKTTGAKKNRTDTEEEIDIVTPNVVDVESKNIMCLEKADNTYEFNIDLKFRDILVSNLKNTIWKHTAFPSNLIPEALFLPTRELLSIYPNYQSLSKKYHLPYDQTYDDTIAVLGLPYQKERIAEYEKIVSELENAIDGKIFLKNEKFYYHPNTAPQGQDFDINMTAEGWRKLGTILQLLMNGGLHAGMVLFWDEPEANLNPQLIRLIAKVIIELSKLDIQVFITTHSLFLLREIDMLTKADEQIGKGDIRYLNFLEDYLRNSNGISKLKKPLVESLFWSRQGGWIDRPDVSMGHWSSEE